MEIIRIYHSFRSPYSRLGLHVIDRAKLDVELIPFTGPPDGIPFNDPTTNTLKLAYARLDVHRMTKRMGLPLSPPDPFDVDMMPSYPPIKQRSLLSVMAKGFHLHLLYMRRAGQEVKIYRTLRF